MKTRLHSRREALSVMLAVGVLPSTAVADGIVRLGWSDLLPKGLSGVVLQKSVPQFTAQPTSEGVRTDWNGQTVQLPGFIVPIDHVGSGVTTFILAPYAGACIHSPPPLPNQLVLVTTKEPYYSKSLFQAVSVTGTFFANATSTDLAEVGYTLAADSIEAHS